MAFVILSPVVVVFALAPHYRLVARRAGRAGIAPVAVARVNLAVRSAALAGMVWAGASDRAHHRIAVLAPVQPVAKVGHCI